MDIGTISLVLLISMLVLLAIGMPLGFASGILAVGVLLMKFGPDFLFSDFGRGPLNILVQRMYGLTTDYVIISVPLFIFMATLLERSGIAKDMYTCLSQWLSRTRGGIALVTSVMAVVMAAMSGIIGGEVVLLGLIVLIMYGLITETSIHALFKAAFVPGFILASLYMVYIIIRTRMNPSLAPLPDPGPDDMDGRTKAIYGSCLIAGLVAFALLVLIFRAWFLDFFDNVTEEHSMVGEDFMLKAGIVAAVLIAFILLFIRPRRAAAAWQAGKGMIAPLLVVFIVLGSIYGGVTGITEAAGMGSAAVMLLIILRGEFSFKLVYEALMRTFKSTGTIIWVTFGATALAGAYTISGGPTYVANLIIGAELPTLGVLLMMMLIFLFLGAFMDWVGIVLLVMPVFLPIVLKLPVAELGVFSPLVDARSFVPVWFGILFCVNMQVSFLSPPFGPAAFYLKSVAPPHITLPAIFRGFLPFIMIQLVVLMAVLFFPELTLFFR